MAPLNDDDLPHVAIDQDGAIATATLNNPARRNALSIAMWRELEAFAVAVSADDDVRVVLFQGEGGVFCAGADVTGFEADGSGSEGARAYDDELERACRAIAAIRQPTVARLEGPVVGAGAALALSCDMRIATDDAFLMVPAARLGQGVDPRAVARLVHALGAHTTRWLLMTAGRLPVQRVFAQGAVHEIVATDDMDDAVTRLVERLAQNAPLTLAAAKVAIHAAEAGGELDLVDEARRLATLSDESDDHAEGRLAFIEQRPAEFEGH